MDTTATKFDPARALEMHANFQAAHATLVPRAEDGNDKVPGLRVIVIGEPGGERYNWVVRVVTQRGSNTDIQLGEMDPALLPALKDPASVERQRILQHWEGFGKVVRALLILVGRPSEYGVTRDELRELADAIPRNGSWNKADSLLERLPLGRPIGKGGAIVLTEQDIDAAFRATDFNPLAVELLRAIAKRPKRRREVSLWLSAEGYERMLKAAIHEGKNVQKLILERLPEEYR